MKHFTIAVLAHVDAGKTTLSEAMLYACGVLRKLGRVDKKDAFFDHNPVERDRGITIYTKQAEFQYGDSAFILLDTPGHVDFSAEMERTMAVLDGAVLVISGVDGVQSHTITLWKLLKRYRIPVFVFINKMDQEGASRERILQDIKKRLDESCVDFSDTQSEFFYEEIAMCDEQAMEHFLSQGSIGDEQIQGMIRHRKLFPCFWGSALRLQGVEELLKGLDQYTWKPIYPKEFGARIYKISRDEQGNRLTHLKITGGALSVKDILRGKNLRGEEYEEKINQIRCYMGNRYVLKDTVEAGEICAVTGPVSSFAGEGIGQESNVITPLLEPLLNYQVCLPEGMDAFSVFGKLQALEEEDPMLAISWNEDNRQIHLKLMGDVQLEILQGKIKEQYGLDVTFGAGSICYRETIQNTVWGAGHYEPLKHYAEVHLCLSPLPKGSGLQFDSSCSEDLLDRNWQRLIQTHLMEKEHRGVLMGAPITDMRITLVSGKAHLKHTEGGDFRQATYRALRQGLMQAESVLLEPYYLFQLELPQSAVGRAMHDLQEMTAVFELTAGGDDSSLLSGRVPIAAIRDYSREVRAYSGGKGILSCSFDGYDVCHNTQEVLEKENYNPLRDLQNPAGSVFCAHGTGFYVEWDHVAEYMHLPCMGAKKGSDQNEFPKSHSQAAEKSNSESRSIGTEEIAHIIGGISGANRNLHKQSAPEKKSSQTSAEEAWVYKPKKEKPEYLLVDGYNIIHAWEELARLIPDNMEGARGRLLDILCNYQSIKQCEVIAVFDAYQVEGHPVEESTYHNIHVVFTRQAQTADNYIERFAHENSASFDIVVATSDGLEQLIITGQGCRLFSARELLLEIEKVSRENLETFWNTNQKEQKLTTWPTIDLPE